MGDGVRQPVDNGKVRVHLDREPAVRRRDERPPADPERLGDEALLLILPAHVLDHRVREDDVEDTILERQLERVGLDVARLGVARAEALPSCWPTAVSCPCHGYISSKKFNVPQLPSLTLSSPKAKSSTPTSSTVVSSVGAIVSMKRPNLRRRERSEIWSASLIRRQE